MTNVLSRDLIEGLRDSTSIKQIDKTNELVYGLMNEVLTSLAEKSAFIIPGKTVLQPVNEVYLRAICSKSEYNYFLGIQNKEIELNSLTKKHYFKNLWGDIKRAWRFSRKKRKKQKISEVTKVTSHNYTIENLKSDIVAEISNYVTASTIIYEYKRYISIVGKDDFGPNVKINIYVCLYDEKTNTYMLYNSKKNRFYNVNFKDRFSNLEEKVTACGENFVNMVKVYNSIYARKYDKLPNQILIESLLCACPDKLYVSDLYQTFINVSNYIRLTDATNIRSVTDNGKSIFDDNLITDGNSQVDYVYLTRILDSYRI